MASTDLWMLRQASGWPLDANALESAIGMQAGRLRYEPRGIYAQLADTRASVRQDIDERGLRRILVQGRYYPLRYSYSQPLRLR